MEPREQAYEDYKQGAKYKDIADKYGVSVNTVKSWAARYWKKDKVATKQRKKAQPKKKLQPKPRGAPLGNKNAVGNHGGAPPGNKTHLIHGGYSAVYWDTLDETEKGMIEDTPEDEEMLLIEQIQLFSVRERRIMQAINKYRGLTDKAGNPIELAVVGVTRLETKREFRDKEEQERFEEIRRQKIEEEKISYLGHEYSVNTATEATVEIIQRLESLLTQVQAKKTRCIESIARLRLEKDKLNAGSKGNEAVDDWVAEVIGGEALDGD